MQQVEFQVLSVNVPTTSEEMTAIMQPGQVIEWLGEASFEVVNQSEVTMALREPLGAVDFTVRDAATLLIHNYRYRNNGNDWVLDISLASMEVIDADLSDADLANLVASAKLPVAVIDIESESTAVDSLITHVAIVVGDLATGDLIAWMHVEVPRAGQEDRTIDIGTIKWWRKEKEVNPVHYRISRLTTAEKATHVVGTLCQIDEFFEMFGEQKNRIHVFANGPEFDSANLAGLYAKFKHKEPWRHGNNQSVRTMVLMGRQLLGIDPKYTERPGMIPHFALHDALVEFRYCSEIFNAFTAALPPLATKTE